MQYLGGKSRLAKKFGPILDEALSDERFCGRFIEPFTGGFNLVPALKNIREAWCCDIHPGLITLYRAIQDGSFVPPDTLSKAEWEELRRAGDWSNPLTAFAAFGCSFGGKEWGGYATNKAGRNYAAGAKRLLKKKFSGVFDQVTFRVNDYRTWPMYCPPAVIYCDPPYQRTTGYRTGDFDHKHFFSWCERRSSEGHAIFVSEFSAPDHWEVVWQLERKITVRADSRYTTKIDKLYKVVSK